MRLAAALAVALCAALGSVTGAPAASAAAAPLPVLPPSSHVTGHYPTACHMVGKLPDPKCTTGSLTAAVTQATIGKTICVSGWTATVRPPTSETGLVKKAAMLAYGQPPTAAATTELDHFVPLELGGSNDVSNLWPEPSDLPGKGFRNSKDDVENALKRAVCAGQLPLAEAQRRIAANWPTATTGGVRRVPAGSAALGG